MKRKYLSIISRICLYIILMFSGVVFSLTRSYNVKHENENRRPDEIVLQSEISKWELYYNKFLVMDNIQIEDDQYDALIETPKSWYNIKAKDGENLPLSGYATYRTTIDTFKKETQSHSRRRPQT